MEKLLNDLFYKDIEFWLETIDPAAYLHKTDSFGVDCVVYAINPKNWAVEVIYQDGIVIKQKFDTDLSNMFTYKFIKFQNITHITWKETE